MKTLDVTLPKGMSISKKKFKKAYAEISARASKTQFKRISSRKFQVTGLPAAGAAKISIRLSKGALKLSKSKRKSLNKGKELTFKVDGQRHADLRQCDRHDRSVQGPGQEEVERPNLA